MESAAKILTSSNGVSILILSFIGISILMIFGKAGFFSFRGKNVIIGRTEGEVRSILLKQKEFVLQYCSYLTQNIISDMAKVNVEVTYVNTDYIVEKVVDEWLGWLLVNHITEDTSYIELKTHQTKLIMLKAIGRVNPKMLQSERLLRYFDDLCRRATVDIIKGVLSVYNQEKK